MIDLAPEVTIVLSVYHYNEPHSFLKDAWRARNQRNRSFSMRAWAQKLGFENPAPLSLMLAGRRPIPKKYVPDFIRELGLSEPEGRYLEALVDYDRARTVKERQHHFDRLRRLSPLRQLRMVEIETFKCLEDPLHTAILEMTELHDFAPCAKWIRRRSRLDRSLKEISDAIERLVALGLLRKERDGSLRKQQAHLSSKPDLEDLAVQSFHKAVSSLAAEQVSVQGVEEREFNAYALNIKTDALPKAKELLRQFVRQFIETIEAQPGEGDETYQLNLQLFSLTQSRSAS
jgi:uncharacterized protein (TIGR02147 family)